MLQLSIGQTEYYDEEKEQFIQIKPTTVRLEHSLKSLAKWESKWKKPFLSNKKITREESIDYIRCMEVTGQIDEKIFNYLTSEQLNQVDEYINDKMTATTINRKGPQKPSREIITAEIIYFWMIQNGIPPEYEKWHLNRLLTLIEVCSIKGGPQKKMGMKEQMAQQRALNAARRAKHHTKG